MVRIRDCRGKEVLSTKRVCGDYEVKITYLNGKSYAFWFQMKKPFKATAEKLDRKFEEIKTLLENQE